MAGWLVRRILWAAGTLVLAAVFTFGMMRLLRPDRLGPVSGTWDDVNRNLLQALSRWAAMLIVALSLLGDLAIMRLDPRVRAGGKPIG